MRLLVLLLVLAVGFGSTSSEAKSKKKKHKHKTTHHHVAKSKSAAKAKAKSDAVNMDMQFEVDGALLNASHVAVPLGNRALIKQLASDDSIYTFAVTPTNPKAGQFEMTFEISRTVDGRTESLGTQKIISLDGEKARIEQSSEGKSMAIEVTAKM